MNVLMRAQPPLFVPEYSRAGLTIFIKSKFKMIEFLPKIINLENKMMSHENNYLYNRRFSNRNFSIGFIP